MFGGNNKSCNRLSALQPSLQHLLYGQFGVVSTVWPPHNGGTGIGRTADAALAGELWKGVDA